MPPSSRQPDLSICVVAWNVREVLRDCLHSIRRAGPEVDHEILVVDNCSRDGTAAMVETGFPEVALIQNDRNRGFASASNQAIRASRGRYLLLLNPDTRVPAGSLEEMGVKAAGGIRTWADAQNMIAAGATRIGASSGVEIVTEAKKES